MRFFYLDRYTVISEELFFGFVTELSEGENSGMRVGRIKEERHCRKKEKGD